MIISWNTTNKCNMSCKHCYRDSGEQAQGELSLEEGKELLNEIAKAGFKIVIFSGGEPLMLPYIFTLVEHAVTLGLRPVFGTNGTLLTEEMAIDLKKAGAMGMGISLDSISPSKHDDLRGLENAWDKAVEGMNACAKAGLPFQIHTTVMSWNMNEIIDLTDFAVDIGAVAHHIFFLVPTGRAVNIEEDTLRAEQYEQLLTKVLKKQQEVTIELKPTCAPQFMRIAKEMGINLRYARGCLAGTHYCIISPTGEVQPCAYINQPIGNVRKTPFSEIWKNSTVFNDLRTMNYKGKCGVCKYKVACGGCRARAAFYNNGDFMAEEPWCLYK